MQPDRQGGLFSGANTDSLVHSRMTDTELLTAHLASRDVPCPKCQYNLRGVADGRCPECGAVLQLSISNDQVILRRIWKIMWWGTFVWTTYLLLLDLHAVIFLDWLVQASWESQTKYLIRVGRSVTGMFAWIALLVISANLYKRKGSPAVTFLSVGFFVLFLGAAAMKWILIYLLQV